MPQRLQMLATMALATAAAAAILMARPAQVPAAAESLQATPPLFRDLAVETARSFQSGSFEAMQGRFADSFWTQVPPAQMNTIPQSYQARFGKVVSVDYVMRHDDNEFGPETLVFHVQTDDGRRAVLRMKLDADNKIVLWHLGPAAQPIASFDAVREQLQELPGRVSAVVRVFDEKDPRFVMRPDEVLAVGSAFKLYVLAELLRQVETGLLQLDSVIRLHSWSMSLPSGQLQRWPTGTPVTVQTLAILMISESDNTATDHLIELVGREQIETRLGRIYKQSLPERNVPFLKTRELFLLRAGNEPYATLRKRYLTSNLADKRNLLLELQDLSIDGMPSVQLASGLTDRIEWFASTRNLADFMQLFYGDEFLRKDSLRLLGRQILGINPGIPNSDADARIGRLGFKGGSEPGVIQFTQWVETSAGRQFVISMTWNNNDAAVDEARWTELLVGLRRATLDALEPQDTKEIEP